MSLAYDDYGRPFIIIKDQQQKQRITGLESYKNNIIAATLIAQILKSSLGPKGLDKMMVSKDNEVMVTNDGATILQEMDLKHPICKLLRDLSKAHDDQIGDGTTGVVILAGALLEQTLSLIDKGFHPIKIINGFDQAKRIVLEKLNDYSETIEINQQQLMDCAQVSLSSKVVSQYKKQFSQIAVDAVMNIVDMERKDINLDLIKIVKNVGGQLSDTRLIDGILIEKEMSHPQMAKEINDAKVLILTCPFEPPKPKTKNQLEINSAENYNKLYEYEQQCFTDMVKKCKDSGADIILCQWGFDDEANYLLQLNQLPSIRWVGGQDIELIAMATGSRIIPRFSEITPQKLGKATEIKEISFGTQDQKFVQITGEQKKAVTILIRGGNQMILDEAERSIHDALCVTKTLINNNKIVYGGGSIELALSEYLHQHMITEQSEDQYIIKSFAEALEVIPMTLADNCGMDAIESISFARNQQVVTNNPRIGINCNKNQVQDTKEDKIIESFSSKKQQIELATEVVKLILKIDDVISDQRI